MVNLALKNAQAELARLERMVATQRELVVRMQAQSRPEYLRPRVQDQSQAPQQLRYETMIQWGCREESLTCLGERTP